MKAYQEALSHLFETIGEDPNREGLVKTPERMANMYQQFITGHQISSDELLGPPIPFDATSGLETLLIDHIPFCALCEHHLVPFYGEVHLTYIPNQSILGLGRIYHYVESVSRKLVLQEKLCSEIATTLFDKLMPHALLVKMSALHSCSALSQKIPKGTSLSTQSFRGNKKFQPQLIQQVHDLT